MGISVACASGAMALAVAAGLIVQGQTKVALAGGSDALCPFTLAGFNALQALDSQACRPFDQARSGLNLGEGAAMLLLEDPAHAHMRGAPILAQLTGWAFSNDACHPTAPDEEGRGLALCMRLAMQMAHVRPEGIGYVNAHGTGTRLNDTAEVRAYEQVFSGRTTPVPVSSTKSYIGHTLGAAGAIEAVVTLLGLRAGRLFPTLRLTDPIGAGSVDLLSGGIRSASMEVAMSVSAGFGGSNASLVFTRCRE
jgi:3-oxoacyl-(acyl-carrier-protein) synthase